MLRSFFWIFTWHINNMPRSFFSTIFYHLCTMLAQINIQVIKLTNIIRVRRSRLN
jgi:hypothetical protein